MTSPAMLKEYRRHKYKITQDGERRYQVQVWLPNADTRAPGFLFHSRTTEEEAEQMAKEWIDTQGSHDTR